MGKRRLAQAGRAIEKKVIERLATPSTKHNATSAQGTNRLIAFTLGRSVRQRQALSRGRDLHRLQARVRFRVAEE